MLKDAATHAWLYYDKCVSVCLSIEKARGSTHAWVIKAAKDR